jgi:hypothetical protein
MRRSAIPGKHYGLNPPSKNLVMAVTARYGTAQTKGAPNGAPEARRARDRAVIATD